VVLGADESEVVLAAGGSIPRLAPEGLGHRGALRGFLRRPAIADIGCHDCTATESLRSDSLWTDAIIASPLLYRQNCSVRDYFAAAEHPPEVMLFQRET